MQLRISKFAIAQMQMLCESIFDFVCVCVCVRALALDRTYHGTLFRPCVHILKDTFVFGLPYVAETIECSYDNT